jgi:hypothetical protein
VRDCDITATGLTNFTAGIYVEASVDAETDTLYFPKNITISDNTISATGNAGYATQGILLRGYDYSIKITDNTISAQYGAAQSGMRVDAPAAALFINRVFGENLMGSGTPQIYNNTLKLEGNSAYSFFINTYETEIESTMNQNGGVAVLRGDNFALADTTWALSSAADTESSYKKLFNALLDNITGTGFGSVSIPYSKTAWEYEHYHIDAGKVTRISVLGDHLTDGKYAGTDGQNNVFNSDDGTPKGVDYGSFEVENGEVKGEKNGKFYFTYIDQDTDYQY